MSLTPSEWDKGFQEGMEFMVPGAEQAQKTIVALEARLEEYLADINKLDAVVAELGIQDDFIEPVDAVKNLKTRNEALTQALCDLCMLERTQAPDMGGKKRTYAMMQNGEMLAEALDRARDLLGIPIGEMVPPPDAIPPSPAAPKEGE